MNPARPVILVTGATGFVGTAVVRALAPRFDVVTLDRKPPREPVPGTEFIPLDVTSDTSVATALARIHASRGEHIASVIHLAAYIDLSNEDDPRYESITVRGTGRLIDALQPFAVGQFVFLSTLLVHRAGGHGVRIDEDAPLDDRFPYRASKICTERLLHERRGHVPIVILRPAGVYDELCHATFLAHQIARIHEQRLISHLYPGDLTAGQPWLHIDDLVDAIARVVDRRAGLPPESTFLLGESDVMGFDEIQQATGQALHGQAWETARVPAPLASAGAWAQDELLDDEPFIRPWMVAIASDHYELDTRRAREQLGWVPSHTLRATLPHMLSALKRDPVGWYEENDLDAARVAADKPALRRAPLARRPGADMAGHLRAAHFALLWPHWANILLGAWLLASPFAFGGFHAHDFSAAVLQVTSERHLAAPELRSLWSARGDVLAGFLVMVFGACSLSPRLGWAQWANAAVGTWLLVAPLVAWAPDAAVYANDTQVGALVIAFSVLVPMMPGMSPEGMADESDLPPGWRYSPSSWAQRLPIIALGAIGFLVARTLAAYQLGHVDHLWDPFFRGTGALDGSETVVSSDVSKAWPVPDAGLGAVAYLFEVLMGAMGDSRRWRTMPWMVAMFGVVVVPLGIVSICFIVIQPLVIGTWCALCLASAAAMLAMIPLCLDELVASGQFLVQSHRRGAPFWRTFLRGGAQPQGGRDASTGLDAPLPQSLRNAGRGVTLPWTLAASLLVGAALMLTRPLLGHSPPLANSDHLVGALIVTVTAIATAEVARALRLLNLAFGAWLLVAPWLLAGGTRDTRWIEAAAGVAVIVASLPRGPRSDESYGSWNRYVF